MQIILWLVKPLTLTWQLLTSELRLRKNWLMVTFMESVVTTTDQLFWAVKAEADAVP
jgi:hypothetical protein